MFFRFSINIQSCLSRWKKNQKYGICKVNSRNYVEHGIGKFDPIWCKSMHERFDKQTIFYQRPTVRLPLNLCDYEIRRRCFRVTIFGKAVLHFNSSVNKTEETQKINVQICRNATRFIDSLSRFISFRANLFATNIARRQKEIGP